MSERAQDRRPTKRERSQLLSTTPGSRLPKTPDIAAVPQSTSTLDACAGRDDQSDSSANDGADSEAEPESESSFGGKTTVPPPPAVDVGPLQPLEVLFNKSRAYNSTKRPKPKKAKVPTEKTTKTLISAAVGLLSCCCVSADPSFLYSEIESSRIAYWENQEGRRRYLVAMMSRCQGKQQSPTGKKYFFPFALSMALCYTCLIAALGVKKSLVYKVHAEVRRGLKWYVNGNRKEMRDESADSLLETECRLWFPTYFATVGDFMPHSKKVHLPPALFEDLHSVYVADMKL